MDEQINNLEPWRKFEDLVGHILEANGFAITRHAPRGDRGFDLLGVVDNGQWAIEVKYYRTDRAQPHLLEAAATRVANQSGPTRMLNGMLVISCVLPPPMRSTLEAAFNINFIDRFDLDNLTAHHPLLSEELQTLLGSNLNQLITPSDEESARSRNRLKPHFAFQTAPEIPENKEGSDLCKRLRAIKSGKQGWSDYEQVGTQILKYLFQDDLEGWNAQSGTVDGLHRFDLACRIKSDKFFWRFVCDNLNSVYVLFEFKNYSEKIKQGQVLTTEKYLLERAMRRVAFIITRYGATVDAERMAQGAMREHGKLMMVLDDEKICKMLHMKEEGDDPTDFLFGVVDEFLLSLSR